MKKIFIFLSLLLLNSAAIFASQPEHKDHKEKAELQKKLPAIPEAIKKAIAAHDEMTVVQFILNDFNNIRAIDEQGNTLLHLAVAHGAYSVMTKLLAFCADEVTFNHDGFAPIHLAAQKGDYGSIFELATARADLLLKDEHGKTLLDYLPSNVDQPIDKDDVWTLKDDILSLIVHCKIDYSQNENPQIPENILKIRNFDHTDDLRRFLNENPNNIRAVDRDGNSLLHRCMWWAGPLLLSRGANPNAINNAGETPLVYLLKHGEKGELYKYCRSLLDSGADVNIKDKDGNSVLFYAFRFEDPDLVCSLAAMLLQVGADPNIMLVNGMFPLHRAAQVGSTILVNSLLARRANLDARDKAGKLADEYALNDNIKKYLAGLREFDALKDLALLNKEIELTTCGEFIIGPLPRYAAINFMKRAIREFDEKTMKELIGNKDNPLIYQADEIGYTALHIAVIENKPKAVQHMIKCGVNKDAQTLYGQTPLHLAVIHGDQAMVQLLIDLGADKNAQDVYGQSPLYLAVMHCRPEMVQLLTAFGANNQARNLNGKTPRQLAEGQIQELQKMIMAIKIRAKTDLKFKRDPFKNGLCKSLLRQYKNKLKQFRQILAILPILAVALPAENQGLEVNQPSPRKK
jgi:ankyrin repeat protein